MKARPEYLAKAIDVAKKIYARNLDLAELPDPMALIDRWKIIGRQPVVSLVCPYCGGVHKRSLYYYLSALVNKTYLPTNFCCSNSDCIVKNKSAVIVEQTIRGETSAKGHIVTDTQKIKRMNTLITRGTIHNIYASIHARTGKTLEEIYGSEKGALVRRKIKENTPHPEEGFFKGHRHTHETKEVLSQKSSAFFKSAAFLVDKKYIHPLTGEACSHREWLVEHNRKTYHDKTDSEKLAILQKQILSLQFGAMINHPYWGLHRAWFEHNATQPFRSSWELLYMEYLDLKKIWYESNKTLYIPYKKTSGRIAYYVPDFLIYDGMFVSKVIEIKPSGLVNADINRRKFKAANEVCKLNNLDFVILTEADLIDMGITVPGSSKKETVKFWRKYENNEDNKVYKR